MPALGSSVSTFISAGDYPREQSIRLFALEGRGPMASKRKFRLVEVILSVICVVFVAEAAAPAAAIGNSQFFWWIFLMVAFLLP